MRDEEHKTKTQKDDGFTLVEVMVVMVIIGLLATFVVLNVLPAQDKAMVQKARGDIACPHSPQSPFNYHMLFGMKSDSGSLMRSFPRLLGACPCSIGAIARRSSGPLSDIFSRDGGVLTTTETTIPAGPVASISAPVWSGQ